MKAPCVAMALLFAVCLAVLSGCGGGEADVTAREISDEELSLMVLAQEEFGAEYAELDPDDERSGFQSNDEVVAEAHDRDDERRDIERFGRVNGYFEAYSSTGSFLTGEGLLDVATGVELLRDSAGASGRMKHEMAEYETELREQAEEEDAQEADLRPFGTGGIGDEAVGLQVRFTIPLDGGLKVSYYATYVSFRRGRLVGAVVVGESEDRDRRDEVAALARKLDERIQAVLSGDITATPAATP
jgi:hypothetical protein